MNSQEGALLVVGIALLIFGTMLAVSGLLFIARSDR